MGSPRSLPALIALIVSHAYLPAQEPWAVEVVSYDQGTEPYSDYTEPESALGRPTVDTYEDFASQEPTVTVVPVYPPWDWTELVSIGEGGELVLKLGKPVTDDPGNPYGIDLLVFSNAMITGSGLYDQYQNDPRTYTMPSSGQIGVLVKAGIVSVSANGTTWFEFSSGSLVGNMLPTLGRVWNGGEWGDPTDPTTPPDPDLTPHDVASMELEDLCDRYRGGAGGTGFDLADLVVPDGMSAPAAIQFVKIRLPNDADSNTALRTEIDAVTVVSPVSGFVRWQQTQFAWTEDPAMEQPEANPESDGFDNWQEYARGGDPKVWEDELPLPILRLGASGFRFSVPLSAREAPWTVEFATDLRGADAWRPVTPQPQVTEIANDDTVTKEVLLPSTADGPVSYRLKLPEGP